MSDEKPLSKPLHCYVRTTKTALCLGAKPLVKCTNHDKYVKPTCPHILLGVPDFDSVAWYSWDIVDDDTPHEPKRRAKV